jgi:hypothetical protein
MTKQTGTEFTSASTNHGFNENGEVTPTLMSPAGKKLASKSAPASAFNTNLVKGGK